MAMSFCSFVRSSVCRLKRVLVGHWPDWPRSAIVLAGVRGLSAAGSVRPVPDILLATGAYNVGRSDHADLFVLYYSC